MKIAILSVGALLQVVALYIAFYSDIDGNIYLATLVSVLSICCLVAIRSLIAPACLLAGILVGLSLSHNKVDLQLITHWEKSIQNLVRAKLVPELVPDLVESPQQAWSPSAELKYSAAVGKELVG